MTFLVADETAKPSQDPILPDVNVSGTTHDDWRVALYYYYVEMGDVAKHVQFHQTLCISLNLKGRVRVSSEGINGVLSGLYESLKLYEIAFIEELGRCNETVDSATITAEDLDLKYCQLRPELSIESQLFDSLMVKETDHVVSLFEKDETALLDQQRDGTQPQKKNNRRSKQSNRRRRRKEKQRKEQEEQLTPEQQAQRDELREIQREFVAGTSTTATTAPPTTAIHLSADEWNSKLSQYASGAKKAMLLDARNVYESRVGHFAVPNVPTMLTNTRKYSDLPQMVLQNKQHFEDKEEVFMYCTGGVRCERFSVLLQSMHPQTKFYQLKGGIQTYLKEAQQQQEEQDHQEHNSSGESSKEFYYRGKNFVFDPRRTDPLQVPGQQKVVGNCLVCQAPHDDYDNGHAPCENREARCINCRMLILVCNSCRPNYICWGDKKKEEDSELPILFCGMDHCIHEGNAPEPEFVRI